MSIKLCKDCEHYQVRTIKVLFWKFTSEQAHGLAKCGAHLDPVHGEGEQFCEFERKEKMFMDNRDRCGPDAKFFVPRTSKLPINL